MGGQILSNQVLSNIATVLFDVLYCRPLDNAAYVSLIPRPSSAPVFDRLQEGLGTRLAYVAKIVFRYSARGPSGLMVRVSD